MKLVERYRRLTFWNKLAAIGSVASIIGLVWAFIQGPNQVAPNRAKPAVPEVDQLLSSVAKMYAFVAVECPGTGSTHPTGLNIRQEVVGTCDDSGTPRAFRWD